MGLVDQPLEIPLVQGLDSKSDPKLVDNTRLLNVVNGTFDGRGTLRKRPGTVKLSNTRQSGATISAGGRMLFPLGKQLVQLNATAATGEVGQALAFAAQAGAFQPRGDAKLLRATKSSLLQNTASRNVDADMGGDASYELFAYSEKPTAGGTSTLYLNVMDVATRALYQNRTSIITGMGAAMAPRVIGTTGLFYLNDSTNSLKWRAFSTSTPDAIGAEVAVVGSVSSTKCFDACARAAGGSLLAYYDTVATAWKVAIVSAAGAITSSATINAAFDGTLTPNGSVCAIAEMSNAKVVFAVTDTTVGVRFYVLSSVLALTNVATVDGGVTATSPVRMAIGMSSTNRSFIALEDNNGVRCMEVNSSAVVTVSPALWAGKVYASKMLLAGQPFYANDNSPVVPAYLNSEVQGTYFLLRGQYSAHGRMMAGGTALASVPVRVPQARRDTDLTLGFVRHVLLAPETGRFETINGTNVTPTGFTRVVVTTLGDTAVYENNNAVALDGKVYLSGACPSLFDGTTVAEEGFHHFPEGLSTLAMVAGNVPNGTYQYCALYEWVDETGTTHRSAPGAPVTYAVLAGPSTVNLTISSLRLTDRTAARGRVDVRVAVYRTTASGTVFYRLKNELTATTWAQNDPSTLTVAFDDSTSDANLVTNEVLPTTGGVLEALPLPACSYLTVHQDRLFGVAEDGTVAYTSKLGTDGMAVASHTDYRLHVPAEGGDLVAIASLEDKLLVFRRTKRYVVFGEGPNKLGNDGTYTDAQPQTDDVGCVDANSVVSTPAGVIFRSMKGYYLVDRGLGLTYVGKDVEGYNNAYTVSVRRALCVPTQNHVRFILTNDTALVFNYEFGQWASWTNYSYIDACIFPGSALAPSLGEPVALLKSNGQVNYEYPLAWCDEASTADTEYLFSFDTAWLKVAGVAGFQRVRMVTLVGDALKSSGDTALRMSFLYDFDDNTAASDAVTGTPTIVSGTYPSQFLLRHKPAQQKCVAMKIRFTEVSPAASDVRFGFALVRLDIAVKRGSAKLPALGTI